MGMVESVLFILVQIIVSCLLWFVAEPSKALVSSIRNGNHYELCKTMISGWKWLLLDWHGSECVCLVWSLQIHWNPSIGSGGGGVRYQPCVVFIWTGWILKVHTGLHFRGKFDAPVSSGVRHQTSNHSSQHWQVKCVLLANEACFLIGFICLSHKIIVRQTWLETIFSPRVQNIDVPGTKEPTKIWDDEFTNRLRAGPKVYSVGIFRSLSQTQNFGQPEPFASIARCSVKL